MTAARLRDFHGPRLELLAGAGPDLFAVETIPDADEAEVLVELLDEIGLPAWFSYSVKGNHTPAGQLLVAAYAVLIGCRSLVAAGVNCSDQSDVLGAVRTAVAVTGLPAVAYPNRGGSWDAEAKRWAYGDPLDLDLVAGWLDGRSPPGGRLLRQRSGRHRGPRERVDTSAVEGVTPTSRRRRCAAPPRTPPPQAVTSRNQSQKSVCSRSSCPTNPR